MTHEEYVSYASEANELEAILEMIPEENVIDRMGFVARLTSVQEMMSRFDIRKLAQKAILTFRGRPVVGSYGVSAEFGTKAVGFFTDAFSAVVAGLTENLHGKGPIPDKQKNQMLITGTALGSFGFEFELPSPETITQDVKPQETGQFLVESLPVLNRPEDAMEKLEQLFELSAGGTDDEVAELLDEIDPRAVRKVSEFLTYLSDQGAVCGLEFKDRFFRFSDVQQIYASAERLKSSNIKESERAFKGEFQGILPKCREFEFKLLDQSGVIRGKINPEISDPNILNQKYLNRTVVAKFHVIQVGEGRPRYTLKEIPENADDEPL